MVILKEKEDRLSRILCKVKERDFRLTPQRLAIIRILSTSETHPTVDEVLELGFPDGSNRYDGHKPYPHPHAICVKCKKIMDPEISSADKLAEEMKEKTGYSIFFHRLDFFGLCPDCQGK